MTIWRRHPADTKFHAGAESCGSFVTRCRGRWSLAEADVEDDANPAHDDRCEVCQREQIEVERVELGLRELTDLHERFDLGGECG